MRITWLGHACFLLEEDGYRIVTDPYTGVEGYPPLEAEAHAVYCSHHHFDHDAVDCVRLLPARESPFHVREIQAFHDDQKGALRGPNTIRVFTAGGVSVVHLGDLGHALSAEQVHSLPGAGLDTETAPEGVLLPKFWLTMNSKSRNIVLNTGLHGLEVRLWSAEQRSHFWGILF